MHDELDSQFKYHFFGKECLIDRPLNDYSNLEESLKKQNFSSDEKVVFVNQIHSSDVLIIDDKSKIPEVINRPKVDAIVTNQKNLIIGLFTADCTPILFFDEKNQVIAAAHAGWTGALNNITYSTIDAIVKIGGKIENIKTIIGPTIRQKSYEVSEEFYERFLSEKSGNEKFFIDSNKVGHFMFDLPGYIKEKLKDAGVKMIIDDEIDTYSNPDKFFSYRRSTHLKEQDCGRNVSVAQIAGN
jgi:YfiH family protein